MYGLKENVIIGKLIPAGTGFDPKRFADQEAATQPGEGNIAVKPMEFIIEEEKEEPKEAESTVFSQPIEQEMGAEAYTESESFYEDEE